MHTDITTRQHATKLYSTIQRQPADLRALSPREDAALDQAAAILRDAARVITTGIGTSHHASVIASWLLRSAGKDALPVHAFDLALYPEQWPYQAGDALFVFGHTGNTTLTRQALAHAEAAGVPIVAVGSLNASHPGATVLLRTTEPETSTTYTSSHLCAMALVARLAGELGAVELAEPLSGLPDLVQSVLDREREIRPVAETAASTMIYAVGAGPNEATATELMIKVREAAMVHVDGMAIEQFLHGPACGFNAGDLAVVVNVPGASSERVGQIARTLRAMGGTLWLIGEAVEGVDAPVFDLPRLPEVLSPLLTLIPVQLFASRLAALKATNPDEFRMDDPVYDHAFTRAGF